MTEWRIEFKPAALRCFNKLDKATQAQLGKALDRLAFETASPAEPKLSDLERYQGTPDQWRLRVGSFRVIFRREGERLVILVLDVGNRRDVYKG